MKVDVEGQCHSNIPGYSLLDECPAIQVSGYIYRTPRGFVTEKRIWKFHKKKDKKTCSSTWNRRKASRIRIKVQLPSVWRTDAYLAHNYNPLKANKSAMLLFQHDVSQAGADAGLFPLIGCWLMRSRQRICSTGAYNRLKGSEVGPGITSITHPPWILRGLIW